VPSLVLKAKRPRACRIRDSALVFQTYARGVDADVILGLMILGLKFNDELDLTAIGTLLLAAATFLSLFFVRGSLKQTQAQIKLGQQQLAQTQEEIASSRTGVQEAHRPVVVPLTGGQLVTLTSGEKLPAGPYVPEPGLLVIPIMNIGLGPALCLESIIEGLDSVGGWSGASSGRQPLGGLTGIGVSGVISLEVAIHDLSDVPGFKLTLTYDDVAGKGWRTVARWIADHGRWEDIAIASRPHTKDPLLDRFQPFRPSAVRERALANLGLAREGEAVDQPD
jgi:phosphotransferase system HPr-like phosphotransfer protein